MNGATKWAEVRVGDLGQVFTGRTPSTKCPEYFGNEFFFVTPGDMHQGKHVHATERSLSKAGANLLRRIQLPPKSICVSCIGWQMGEVVMTSATSFTNQQINSIVPNNDVDGDFLYYSFVPRKQELLSLASAIGVRTPILNKSGFSDLHIMLPPLPMQRKIAAILSAYDDLIENNTRRIKILEEMAQSIYREWFVNFRFPGHEKLKMVDSPMGKIPAGWEVRRIGDICNRIIDKFSENEHNSLPLLDLSRIPRRSCAISDFGKSDEIRTSRTIFAKGDILFGAIRPYFHKVILAPIRGVTNISVFTLRAFGETPNSFLFSVLFSDATVQWANQHSGGTKMPVINWDVFTKMKLPYPPLQLIKKFDESGGPICDQISFLILKNFNLRQTRDLLLPKLISGKLDVSDLDIKTDAIGNG